MRGRNRGFTLIELLVVIAIIAILAAILFPVFISAKRRGQMTTCTSNLKQIGTAMSMYMDDSSNKFPYYLVDPGESFVDTYGNKQATPFPGHPWLQSYVKNKNVFVCQVDPTRGTAVFKTGKGNGWPGWVSWPSAATPPKVTTSYWYWASHTLQTPGYDPRITRVPAIPAGLSWVDWKRARPSQFMIVDCEQHAYFGNDDSEIWRVFRPALYLDGSVRAEPGHQRDGLN